MSGYTYPRGSSGNVKNNTGPGRSRNITNLADLNRSPAMGLQGRNTRNPQYFGMGGYQYTTPEVSQAGSTGEGRYGNLEGSQYSNSENQVYSSSQGSRYSSSENHSNSQGSQYSSSQVQHVNQPSGYSQAEAVKDRENSPIYNAEIGRETSLFSFEREDILKGIIYAEVLGKPKSRKAGR